ncbi:hypothetical protein R6Q57_006860 [Mikania cordata]
MGGLGFETLPQRKRSLRGSGGFPNKVSSWDGCRGLWNVQEVNLAAETALCRGSNDCTHPSSDGHLSEAEKRGTGEAVDLDGRWNFGDEAGDLGMEADMKADLRFEIEDLFTNLLHLEAIANIARLGF